MVRVSVAAEADHFLAFIQGSWVGENRLGKFPKNGCDRQWEGMVHVTVRVSCPRVGYDLAQPSSSKRPFSWVIHPVLAPLSSYLLKLYPSWAWTVISIVAWFPSNRTFPLPQIEWLP